MPAPIRLFLSAVPEDAAWRAALDARLKPLARHGLIEVWHEGKVDAGGEPTAQARTRLEAAVALPI